MDADAHGDARADERDSAKRQSGTKPGILDEAQAGSTMVCTVAQFVM
jgi:hypothetical protein